jgi:TolA-binding protein
VAKHKKIDKDDLKGPDAFVTFSDIVFNYVEKHFTSFISIVAVIVVVAIGYEGVNFLNSLREQKAAEALFVPEDSLKKVEADFQEKNAPAGDDKKAEKQSDKSPVVADYNKDYAPIVGKIKAAIKEHADTKAAVVSALNLSYFLSQQKQYPEAQAVLDIPTYKPSHGELLSGFWLMHRGVTYMENNQVDQAINAYQTVLSTEGLKVFYPEALLKLGVAYELKGDANKAREMYERVGKDFPETEASGTAQQYIRLLELKSTKKG